MEHCDRRQDRSFGNRILLVSESGVTQGLRTAFVHVCFFAFIPPQLHNLSSHNLRPILSQNPKNVCGFVFFFPLQQFFICVQEHPISVGIAVHKFCALVLHRRTLDLDKVCAFLKGIQLLL